VPSEISFFGFPPTDNIQLTVSEGNAPLGGRVHGEPVADRLDLEFATLFVTVGLLAKQP
jgi:hypothetical protein